MVSRVCREVRLDRRDLSREPFDRREDVPVHLLCALDQEPIQALSVEALQRSHGSWSDAEGTELHHGPDISWRTQAATTAGRTMRSVTCGSFSARTSSAVRSSRLNRVRSSGSRPASRRTSKLTLRYRFELDVLESHAATETQLSLVTSRENTLLTREQSSSEAQ